MKRFRQFLQEREDVFNMDQPLLDLLKHAASEHKDEVMSFLDDLAISDHNLRNKLNNYKDKSKNGDDKLPNSRPRSDLEEIVPSSADAGGNSEEDGGGN